MPELSAVQEVMVWIVPIILAVTLHEAAHGDAALLLGDRTALERGRVSLNPIRRIDPVGTVIFPAAALLLHAPLFGWAKPVPVDFSRLRHPRRDMMLVALAGPATNILLILISMALLLAASHLPDLIARWAALVLDASILLNAVLAVFNLCLYRRSTAAGSP